MGKVKNKVEKSFKIPISDKDANFLSSIKEAKVKAIRNRLKGNLLILLDKLARGVSI